ncbi:TPA: hypothetical protein IQA27_000376 [Listeria monocytogenes]|nr:hypothetical protein [Listeria monocytogenes]
MKQVSAQNKEEMSERIHPHDDTSRPEEIWDSLDWIKVILVYAGQLEKVSDVYLELVE